MKSVLISIRPEWCGLIANGYKTVEIRKTMPKIQPPFRVYIYCTKSQKNQFYVHKGNNVFASGNGKVVGQFICDHVFPISVEQNSPFSEERGGGYIERYSALGYRDCLSDEEFDSYLGGKDGFGWHISDIWLYEVPKELHEFRLFFECHRGIDRSDCIGCWDCEIKRPPQSWCYVEDLT